MNRVKLSKFIFSTVVLFSLGTLTVNAAHHEQQEYGSMQEEHGSMNEGQKGSMMEKKGSMKDKGSHADEMGSAEDIKSAMMEKWRVYATPNANHRLLSTFVGEWDYVLKWWMSPNGPAEESKGTSVTSWILGGRFIEQKVNGFSMGQPFEGLGITGYDNQQKSFTSMWLDNMGTGVMTGASTYNAQTQTFSESGSMSCPFEGKKTYRAELQVIDENQYTYKMFTKDYHSRDEFLSMEITYMKKK